MAEQRGEDDNMEEETPKEKDHTIDVEKGNGKGSEGRMRSAHDYFVEYCTNTSIHGCKYLAEERSLFERLLWACLICTSVITCLYFIHRVYNKYSESPVIVTFATKESPIYTIPFPAVTICPMAKSRRREFNFTDVVHRKWDNATVDETDDLNGQYMSMICEQHTELFPKNDTFTDDFFDKLNKLRLPLEEIFLECYLLGEPMGCSDFVPVVTDESICYTFNMYDMDSVYRDNVNWYRDVRQIHRNSTWNIENGYSSGVDAYPIRAFLSGSDNALDLTLLQAKDDLDYMCLDDTLGFSILLHPPYVVPLLKKQFIQVPLDEAVYLAVKPNMITTSKDVKKYRPQERECYFSDEVNLKYFKVYSPDNCRLECLTNFTLKECGCVHFYMPRENTTSLCGNGKLKCIQNATLYLKISEIIDQIEENNDFFCDCKPLCTELSYSIESSSASWNYAKQVEAFRNKHYIELLDEYKLTRVSIFFKSESFLTSERNELYGTADLIGNFGGLLGLFTGFSLLSLIEIIYFLTLRICCNLDLYRRWSGQ